MNNYALETRTITSIAMVANFLDEIENKYPDYDMLNVQKYIKDDKLTISIILAKKGISIDYNIIDALRNSIDSDTKQSGKSR